MAKVSVLIPSRNEPYLQKTVDDLFAKAKGEIEVIVLLDGYWPDPILKDRGSLILIHSGEPRGMRKALNGMAGVATGKYLMKTDAHCMFGEGYDEILKADCEEDWLAIPSRFSLMPEEWKIRENRPAVEYDYLTFPYVKDSQFGTGLHAKKWIGKNTGMKEFYIKETENREKLIDDIMTWQGSCWFCHKKKFFDIDRLDTMFSFNIHQEAQELGFKFLLSGGRLIVNKKTWYAHWHKDNESRGRGYRLSYDAMRETERMGTWYWMNDQWPKATRKMKWLIEKFWPIPGWPENWEEVKKQFETENPKLWGGLNFRIFDEHGHNALGLHR
jgi:glycosyltransferase involved in cell wall biosynthesis